MIQFIVIHIYTESKNTPVQIARMKQKTRAYSDINILVSNCIFHFPRNKRLGSSPIACEPAKRWGCNNHKHQENQTKSYQKRKIK